jgi:hypothetical protein
LDLIIPEAAQPAGWTTAHLKGFLLSCFVEFIHPCVRPRGLPRLHSTHQPGWALSLSQG